MKQRAYLDAEQREADSLSLEMQRFLVHDAFENLAQAIRRVIAWFAEREQVKSHG